MNRRVVPSVASLVFLAAAHAWAADAPRCSIPDPPASAAERIAKVDADFLDNDCCRTVPFKCDTVSGDTHISPAVRIGKRNIVLVVADDQGYCQYGFMHGYCDSGTVGRAGGDCRSNIDCPSGQCIKRETGLGASTPLRLSDFTCRYRQPPSRDKTEYPKACKYKGADGPDSGSDPDEQPDRKGSNGGDRNSFPFHASNFPCTTTNRGGAVPTYPVALTPYLDQLASHGALFTRAYLGGNACKTSRPVLLYGKPHRHLLEMDSSEEGSHSIASWLLANGNQKDSDPDTAGYWPFLLGKGEAISETGAGFKGGKEKSKPAVAKYECVDRTKCQDAATAAPGGADHLKVPYEVRSGTRGIGDALNVIEGRRGVRFIDKGVIVRSNVVGGSTDCTPCGDHATATSGCDSECGSQLTRPFFLWFAPNQPHKRGRGDDYEGLYPDTFENRRRLHDGRVTQMDQAVGTLIDELKRHCICGWEVDPNTGEGVMDGSNKKAQKQSLWEHTVMIYIADHGFFLPDAKRTDSENTHRTVLMVSEPRHRLRKSDGQPLLPARQFPDQIAHAIDVHRTVLDYAGTPFTQADGDPIQPGDTTHFRFARSLKSWVSDIPKPTANVRDVAYGEDAGTDSLEDDVVRGKLRSRYLVTRPGLVGFCMNGTAPVQTSVVTWNFEHGYARSHARPCLVGVAGACTSGTCTTISRCINDPSKTCNGNADCIDDDFCQGGICKHDWRGSLGDMARPVEPYTSADDSGSRACPSGELDCVPAAVSLCQPAIFKVRATALGGSDENLGTLVGAWDLNWDPDERRNLIDSTYGDPGYLGSGSSSLAEKFEECLNNYWTLDLTPSGGNQWAGTYDASDCHWVEPTLP